MNVEHSSIDKMDAIKLLDIITESLEIRDLDAFKECVLRLQDVFPHNHSFCSMANLKVLANSDQSAIEIVDINYPEGLFECYFAEEFNKRDPVIKEFAGTLAIQNWKDAFRKNQLAQPDWMMDYNMVDGYTHGILEPTISLVTTFSFGGTELSGNKRTETIINYLIPHLTEAFKRCLGKTIMNDFYLKSVLTNREIEVLHWLKQGKSSWEISAILNISERTTNFHVNNVMSKLNASNRTHAVAIACSKGLIEL